VSKGNILPHIPNESEVRSWQGRTARYPIRNYEAIAIRDYYYEGVSE